MGVDCASGRVVRRLAIVTLGLVLLGAARAEASMGLEPPASSPGSSHSIECPISVPDVVAVDCGELIVPENYDAPAGARVRLPYIILRSPSPDPAADPVVFTAGGPGFSSLDSVWGFVESPLLRDRDVIVFEQRGNRYATPALMCDASVWWEEKSGHTPCLDQLRAMGIDITQYSTHNIVRDVVALRHALGYERWNLYGSSFSTSVMLLTMEADPEGTRSAILQSVKPPSETTFAHRADSPLRAIEQMFADCSANSRCAASYPDLAADFFALVRQLNEKPVEMEIKTSAAEDPLPITFDGDRFIDWIVVDNLYQPFLPGFDASYLPLLIDEALTGNVQPLEVAAKNSWRSSIENPNWAWGLMLAINCQQDVPAAGPLRSESDLAASERLDGFGRSGAQLDICEAWALPRLSPAAIDYPRSKVPALVLAGTHDPVTPPAWSKTTAEHLSNSTYVEFPAQGHSVTADNPCAGSLEARFLEDPEQPLDTSCVATSPGPNFVLRSDTYVTPGIFQSAQEVSLGAAGGVAWVEAVAAVSVYGAVLLAVILIVVGLIGLVKRIRHRTDVSDRSVAVGFALSCGAVVGTIVVFLLLDRVNAANSGQSALALTLGPSRDLLSARLLAWAAPVAGVVVLALGSAVTWAWIRARWSLRFRLLTTLSAVSSLAMVFLGVRWGLFTMLL